MRLFKTLSSWSFSWFRVGIIGLLLLCLGLRFWGLGRFNTLVFDEVYYVKFAHNYLTHTPFFDGHPPLSKYLIAIGMWIGNSLPIGKQAVNTMVGEPYSTWSYRWLNAFTGSLIPLVMVGMAYQLTYRRSYAFLTGLFAALDGLILVESRYALNNVYLVIFGLLGLYFFLLALNSLRSLWRTGWLLLAGLCFGASVSVKWNGLWFLLGVYGLWTAAWAIQWLQSLRPAVGELFPTEPPGEPGTPDIAARSPLQRLTRLKLWQLVVYLGIIPAVVYVLIWIPHLQLNAKTGLWSDFLELQQQILQYHEHVGDGSSVHPYCSKWYTWPLLIRPVAYFFRTKPKNTILPEDIAVAPPSAELVVDVHSMGNPILWWLSTAAIVVVIAVMGYAVVTYWRTRDRLSSERISPKPVLPNLALSPNERWLGLFLVINYAANLLPWVTVTRCTFLYHYMEALVFAIMTLAWLCDRWLHSSQIRLRRMGLATMLAIGLAFLFWLPLYLGLPLSPTGLSFRFWLPSWI
jgi:dolichyl-phosphate-mannose--protein O-mannosyl transferase